MCHFETSWQDKANYFEEVAQIIVQLKEMENDGLVIIEKNGLKVTNAGKPFVRNICMAFDLRLKRKAPDVKLFSMTI
jgi:oxygen-independent coproporphyrinogen-3 oxidase